MATAVSVQSLWCGAAPPTTGAFPRVGAALSHHHPSNRASLSAGGERPESSGSCPEAPCRRLLPFQAKYSWRPQPGPPLQPWKAGPNQ